MKIKLLLSFILLLALIYIYNIFNTRAKREAYKNENVRSITYVLIDGLDSKIFKQELDAGHLPFLKSLIEKSTFTMNGISSFPTMTGFAFYPFITGVDAVESGVYGLRWFDKDRPKGKFRNYVGRSNVQMNHDLKPNIKTIFELIDSNEYSCSINTYMNRGVKESLKTGYAHTTAKYEDRWVLSYLKYIPLLGKYLSPNHFEHEEAVTNMAIEQLKYNPRVQWITYPSPDASNHVEGTNDRYIKLLRFLDGEIAKLVNTSTNLGQTKRAFAIISDHGVEDVTKNIDPCIALQSIGLNIQRGKATVLYGKDLLSDDKTLEKISGHFVINGNLSAYIYLKDKNARWKGKLYGDDIENFRLNDKSINLAKTIVDIEGIDMVAYGMKNNDVKIKTKNGDAIITKSNEGYSYRITQGECPFGWDKEPSMSHMINQYFFSDTIWRNATLNTNFPDALHRVYSLMNKEKVGDLLLLSSKGFDFGKDYESVVGNYKGGHGGLRKSMLIVPYILYFPNKPKASYESLRSEETGRLILDWLLDRK